MLVVIPRIIAHLGQKISHLFKRNYRLRIPHLKIASNLVSVFFIFAMLPLAGLVGGSNYSDSNPTTVKLDTNNPLALSEPDRTVNIPVGTSRYDLARRGMTHDPAQIKLLIQEIAPEYGVDWRLVYAIGYLESGNFNSSLARYQNNFFGRKASSGVYASWPSTIVAINNQCEYLKTHYLDRGLETPYQMNRVYAEGDTWGAKVTGIMNSL